MKVSVILLDWSVRESFHSIHYLHAQKGVARSQYELIWVEYFSKTIPELAQFHKEGKLDEYLVCEKKTEYYNKHVAWNEGVAVSKGEIVILCDSDAMFSDNFIKNVIVFFEKNKNVFLHLDEIRNNNKKLWPFKFLSWSEVMATPGLANWDESHGVTTGLLPHLDNLPLIEKLFIRNYGACLCVRRNDYIKFGGLDEHETFNGLHCGVYDLTFRMINAGLCEKWDKHTFLLHTYHPWANPVRDPSGPHIKHISTTSLKQFANHCTMPIVENLNIEKLRIDKFTPSHRSAKVMVSVIVIDVVPEQIRRMYNSINRSSSNRFEIIAVGGTKNCEFDKKEIIYSHAVGGYLELLMQAIELSSGELLVLAHPLSLFRPGSIDNVEIYMKIRGLDMVYIPCLYTNSNGFLWSDYSYHNNYTKEHTCLAISRTHKKFLLRKDLNIPTMDSEPCIDIWGKAQVIRDYQLDQLLGAMLECEYVLNHGHPDSYDFDKTKSVLKELVAYEREFSNEFCYGFIGTRYNVIDFYRFVGAVRSHGLTFEAMRGYETIVRFLGTYKKEIESGKFVNPFGSAGCLIQQDIDYFSGISSYQIGNLLIEQENVKKARHYFQQCLELIPGHKKAQEQIDGF